MVKNIFHTLILLILAIIPGTVAFATNTGALRDGDRIIFVGDSITGLGSNNGQGFVHLIESVLRQTHPSNTMQFVALGGSGQSVASWLSVEKESRRKECLLDVPGVGVQTNLDRGADVLVVMLGMNDVLAPYVSDTATDLDTWTERYRSLIRALRERVHPRVLAVASVTMATEDPASPPNRLIAAMNGRLAALARAEQCLLLPTSETMHDVLRDGRQRCSDFHVTYDFVHPNAAGHVAIAAGMLKGLGEDAAAQSLLNQAVLSKGPSLSYAVEPVAGSLGTEQQTFRLRYWWTATVSETNPPNVRVSASAGWDVAPTQRVAVAGEFMLRGRPDRLRNVFAIHSVLGSLTNECAVTIPAPWLLCAGEIDGAAWIGGQRFNPASGSLSNLPPLVAGASPSRWQRHIPSVNYTGMDSPDSVDFRAISLGTTFEAGYGMRWIHSDRERAVTLRLGSATFAGDIGLTVWLNGQQVYAGLITKEPKKTAQVSATLRTGENTLVFKSNHRSWQWQVLVGLTGEGTDDLSDLQVRTTTPANP